MKRTISTAVLACLTLVSAGCCYRAGGCDPHSGMSYAGQWEPSCCGPLDPFGMWCGGSQQGCSPQYGQGYGGHAFQEGCCPQPNYGTGYPGQMMAPQTFANPDCYSNGMPSGTIIPEGSMKPAPAPGSEDGNADGSKKSTTLVPQPMSPGTVMHSTNSGKWVKAF